MILTAMACIAMMIAPAGFSTAERALTSKHVHVMNEADQAITFPEERVKHVKASRTIPLFNTWNLMLTRCYNKTNESYPEYGGRGIRVCLRWHHPENFMADMEERPSSRHSLDRIDNMGHYCPENCRWATSHEQANNKRNNLILTHNGRTQTLARWCAELGLNYKSAANGITRYKYPAEWVLTPKEERRKRGFCRPNPQRGARIIEHNGRVLSLSQWSREIGISVSSLLYRIERWGMQKALSTPPPVI